MQRVNHELSVFFVANETGVAEDAEMMRNVCQFVFQHVREIGDSLRSAPEALYYLQAIGIGQRLQVASALPRL